MNPGERMVSAATHAEPGGVPKPVDDQGCRECGQRRPTANPTPGATVLAPSLVYAIGRIEPQFPDLGVEKEFAQLGAGAAQGTLEWDRLLEAIRDPENAYLARQLCWVFNAAGSEAFVLIPRGQAEVTELVEALPYQRRG
jgi:hypothetical protein